MIYYLETNAIRQLSKYLNNDSDIAKFICYTSFLTIFELISGITERDFVIRRRVLNNINKSKINIIWETPRERLAEAFSSVLLYDKLKSSLQKIMKVILECNSLEEVNNEIKHTDLYHSLDKIIEMDFNLIDIEKNERKKRVADFRQNNNSEIINKLRKLIFPSNQKNFKKNLNIQKENKDVLLGKLGTEIAYKMPGPQTNEKLIKVLESYDGSLDWYLYSYAYLQSKGLVNNRTSGKNDYFDISHFIYIKKESQIIVSDDKLICEICQTFWPKQYSSIDNLKSVARGCHFI